MFTAHFTLTHWWIAAIVAGLALAAAVQSLAAKPRNKLIAAASVVLAAGLYTALRGSGDGARQALQLFILGTLPLAVLRLVFAGYFRRQLALMRSGQPIEDITGKQQAIFFASFVAVVICIVIL
ncbi:hypothetical protein [Streptomyces sp. PSKA30]|uniref:hypothetical protein n=1 Tax=Streptomyces sp. PSKA30 TaxID=2874597 RepID=UPI001CD0673D|nr:hypothetical protein [Streptomyces sp. PSKA30]MBZ9641488.1 hypothetical protein [Streptomyces sp. PSKA30]